MTMKRLWLLFSQTVTVLLAAYFVVSTLQPGWIPPRSGLGLVTILQSGTPTAAPAHGSLSSAARTAAPAVVSINTSKASQRPNRRNTPWFFAPDNDDDSQASLGSGVIVSPSGLILTNYHVIEGADQIEVVLNDTRRANAKVIGSDPDTDLAVLKINLDRLPAIVMGNSDQLSVGDQVLAIGNPFGVGQTVTAGIVSALGRNQLGLNTFENFIQTDAAINPGNSGGALVDTQGHLLGINTAIYSQSGGSMGIGFAIPVSTAKSVMESLVREGQVTRGWIGVEPNDINPELAATFGLPEQVRGVLITGVLQNGPAAQAGLRPGDVITQINGHPTAQVTDLLNQVAALRPGTGAPIQLLRQGQSLTVTITPGVRPKTPIVRRR